MNLTLEVNSQPRPETDIFAMLYIAEANAKQAVSGQRQATLIGIGTLRRLKVQKRRMGEHEQQDAQLEAQANAARSERMSVR